MSERVSPDQVMVGVVEALNIYADEISSRSINIDEDRHRKLTNTVEKVIEEVESLGIDVDVQKVTRLQSDLDFMSSLKNLSL